MADLKGVVSGRIAVWAMVAAFACGTPIDIEAADALVTTEAATFELCASCAAPQIRVLVNKAAAAKIDANDQPAVDQVLAGGQLDAGLRTRFTAKWEADAAGTPRAIDISYTPESDAPTLRAASYDLYLALQPKTNLAAPRLRVTITKPAPAVSIFPKLLVTRTAWVPFLHWVSWLAQQDASPQTLRETSGKSNLTGLTIEPATAAAMGTRLSTGSLEFEKVPALITAGTTHKLPYHLTGDFGLGTTTGTMRLIAAEKPEALATFDFEVRNRITPLYLVLTLAGGLLCSWLLKVQLQQSIERGQAFVDAAELLARVDNEEARHIDPTFRAAYKRERDALATQMESGDAKAINDAKLALDTVWKNALQALTTKRLPEVEAHEQFDAALRIMAGLDLPADQLRAITEARAEYAPAAIALDSDEFATVHATRDRAMKHVAASLLEYAKTWKPRVRACLDVLSRPGHGLSAALAAEVGPRAVVMATTIDKVDEAAVITTTDQLKQLAVDLHTLRIAARQFFSGVAANHRIERIDDDGELRRAQGLKRPDAFEAVRVRGAAAESTLEMMAQSPDSSMLAGAFDAVHEAWTQAFRQQFDQPDDEVEVLVDAGKYREALALTQRKVRRSQPLPVPNAQAGIAPHEEASKLRTISDRGQAEVLREQEMVRRLMFQWNEPAALSPTFTILRVGSAGRFDPQAVGSTPITTRGALLKAKLLQTIGVGVLAALGGYGLFAGTWVGTFADFSAAFFWAFGLDMTVAAVLAAVKK